MTATPVYQDRLPLSYADLIGIKASDRLELSEKVQIGFPFKAFDTLTKSMELTNQQLANLVQISDRTLNRRRKDGKLNADESERLLQFSRIYTMAVDLFEGDSTSAQEWLSNANRALRGLSPLTASKTEIGSREVENLIIRLEQGVFS